MQTKICTQNLESIVLPLVDAEVDQVGHLEVLVVVDHLVLVAHSTVDLDILEDRRVAVVPLGHLDASVVATWKYAKKTGVNDHNDKFKLFCQRFLSLQRRAVSGCTPPL